MRNLLVVAIIIFLTGCGAGNSLRNYPAQDREVYDLLKQANKNGADKGLQSDIAEQYNAAVARHQENIGIYKSNTQPDWESILKEYRQLQALSEAVRINGIKSANFTEEYAKARQDAARDYYNRANQLLAQDNRTAAQEAYDLLQEVQRLSPGYANASALAEKAYNKSILHIVISPVDYFASSYRNWGYRNDYIQQDLVRDLSFQLSSSTVKVYSELEARSRRIQPDRLVQLKWDEMFMPTPYDQSFARQVSKQIQVGVNEDKTPIYQTVTATLYVTRRSYQSNGSVSLRVIDPQDNRVLLWDNFPSNYVRTEEYATYRGDSRALSAYDWALVNNRPTFRDPSRGDMYTNAFRQVYPQIISRIRSITW